MGVTLPAWADGILGLAGVPWPNIDEDEMRKDAHAWRTLAAGSAPAAEGADRTVRQTSSTYMGASATALAGHWEKTGGTGHLEQAARAARVAPVVLDGAAYVVTGTKVAVITQASVTAVRLATSMLAGGPLALGTATATVLAGRYAMNKILREAGEGGARVLAPGLTRRVTEPLAAILRNARGPGGGGPVLAGAGGPRVPMAGGGFRQSGNSLRDQIMHMGRKDKNKGELSQSGRKPHRTGGSKSTSDKHQGAASHGGRKKWWNPNKRKDGK
ncbi:hypothetical protein [Sphaerisporangium sp. TRM90804]|uniref:WXG100-like domain-containing protein n=1 Tax=Sphaerisporangium sp. TRM90804 TaxID=3031113 RepID=UPI002446BD49|nr:hypothetical protein [Sphaerisporangium sp. TRM90804]MDH2427928.1 hypothetical protein [Sphaerisporangium sp. TRM90804]